MMKNSDRLVVSPKTWVFILIQLSIVILAIGVGFVGHYFYTQYFGGFSLLREAQKIVLENTINEIPSGKILEYGMIRGMLSTFDDPYTYFVEPDLNEIQTDELTGSYGGIGVRLEQDSERNWRIFPLPESPALDAGILDGDILVNVEELSISDQIDEVTVIAALRGPVGKKITLTILRDGVAMTFTIHRESYSLPSVTYNLLVEDPHIGLILINRVSETTASEISAGIQALMEQGARFFILDLRDNGGGLVESGVDIVRLFVSSGEIIQQDYRGEEPEAFVADEPAAYPDLPLILLINGNTASAAEIVSGALKNHHRAVLIGQPTFGKIAIQYVFDLQDGSSVHVTSGRWWIPGIEFPLVPNLVFDEGTPDNELYLEARDIFLKDLGKP